MPSRLRYKAASCSLAKIKSLLEGYDNLAIMSTIDAREGLFELKFPEVIGDEVKMVMEGISEEVKIEEG